MSAILEGSNSTIQAQLGFKGETGDSAYEIAVKHGYTGTEAQWSDDFLNAENYYDKTEMNATLANYDTSSEVDTKLASYDTSAEVDAKIVGKIKNANSASTTDTYSCNYINENIVDSGSNSNGYYVKYYDGTMLCWGSSSESKSSSQSGALYYASQSFTFPVEFIDIPIVIPAVNQPSGVYFSGSGNTSGQSTTATQVRAITTASFSNVTFKFSYVAIGKWK